MLWAVGTDDTTTRARVCGRIEDDSFEEQKNGRPQHMKSRVI